MFLDENGLKQGDYFSPVLFNFALGYAIRRVRVNQAYLKLNGTHQLLVFADEINILGGSVHTLNKCTDTLVVSSMETGLEVNADGHVLRSECGAKSQYKD
jgi:hypothetical protein